MAIRSDIARAARQLRHNLIRAALDNVRRYATAIYWEQPDAGGPYATVHSGRPAGLGPGIDGYGALNPAAAAGLRLVARHDCAPAAARDVRRQARAYDALRAARLWRPRPATVAFRLANPVFRLATPASRLANPV